MRYNRKYKQRTRYPFKNVNLIGFGHIRNLFYLSIISKRKQAFDSSQTHFLFRKRYNIVSETRKTKNLDRVVLKRRKYIDNIQDMLQLKSGNNFINKIAEKEEKCKRISMKIIDFFNKDISVLKYLQCQKFSYKDHRKNKDEQEDDQSRNNSIYYFVILN